MSHIFDCLVADHDPWLMALAGLICLLSSLAAVSLTGQARDSQGDRHRLVWLATASVATGLAIWSTHFVAMLAYRSVLPMGYDLALTILSLLVAVAVSAVGLGAYLARRRWLPPALAGAMLGTGIVIMHYTGMAAVRFPGTIEYAPGGVLASVVLGVGLGAATLWVADRRRGVRGMLAATALLALAITTMHFSAMTTMTLVPDVGAAAPERLLSDHWLAVGVAAASLTVVLLCLASSLVDRHLAQRAEQESQRLATLTDASTEGVVICSGDRIEYGNGAFLAMSGTAEPDLAGASLGGYFDEDVLARFEDCLKAGCRKTFESVLRTRGGGRVPVELLVRPLPGDGDGDRRVVVARDLTERKQSQARIEFLAYFDGLTGLPNRIRFKERLHQDLARAARTGERLAVLCIDLDRFKEVNDTQGHDAGDELLAQVAARIQGLVEAQDTVARLSGDEFAVIQAADAQPDSARRLAGRLADALRLDYQLSDGLARIGASIGVAVFPDDGATVEEMLRRADMALYRAKSEGRDTYRFFEPAMDTAIRTRRLLEVELRAAIDSGGLQLEYQPQADAGTGAVIGFEALVRWEHPTRGRLAPGEFIGVAEDSGLIIALGEWVLRQACRDAAAWSRPLKVAVNLSPVQFQRAPLGHQVAEVLAETGLDPARLELEITESVLMSDRELAVAVLHDLKRLGVSLAMDDFGTGYSSLSYLQSFPFDKIKIDRSFVMSLADSEDARAIVKAVIGLSHALGLPIVAEGVEDHFQLDFLRRAGCTEVQGYLIGRPAPIAAYRALVAGEVALRRA